MSGIPVDRRVFLAGVAGLAGALPRRAAADTCGMRDPAIWLSVADAEATARERRGPDAIDDAIEGSAQAMARFRLALGRFTLRPHVLVDTSRMDLSLTLLGRTLFAPLLVAPQPARGPHASDIAEGALLAQAPLLADLATPGTCAPVRDAREAGAAVRRGAGAVVVMPPSGGGQTSSIEALPAVAEAVGAGVPVLIAGSFRHGNEILIALALGAKAAVIGWPVVWGAAAAGAAGVQKVLTIMQTELALAMALSGRPTLRDVNRGLVRVQPV